MADEVVAKEQAEKEFENWCEITGIDYEVANMNEEDAKDFETLKKRLVDACRAGRLVFSDGDIEYTVSERSPENFAGTKMTIGQPMGSLFTAMDGMKETQNFKKLNCVMSAMTGKDNGFFNKIHATDYKVLQAIASFFLSI